METLRIIIAFLTGAIVTGVLIYGKVIDFKRNNKPRLLNAEGEEVKVNDQVKEELIKEYKLIQKKKSKFSKSQRDKVLQLVSHLVDTGEIKAARLNG